jgi:putative SOS response-associated peptidase YedK
MCGRFAFFASGEDLAAHFDLDQVPTLEPRYNIAPTQMVAIVRIPGGGHGRELVFTRWGLIPHWARDPGIGNRSINARAETVALKPSFRHSLRQRRCLIPANGFYEWQTTPEGKQPIHFRRRGGGLFAFAGLWDCWQKTKSEAIESCTILTTQANELVRPVHERMPVIIPVESYILYLNPTETEPARIQPLLRPFPAESMEAVGVGRWVNNPSHEGPRCLGP